MLEMEKYRRLLKSSRKTIERLRREKKELYERACVDPLTEVGNGYALKELSAKLEKLPKKIKEGQNDLIAVLYVDVDNFKIINREYGHRGGDLILKEFVEVLRGLFQRKADSIIRLGGHSDEFIVVWLARDKKQTEEYIAMAKSFLAWVRMPKSNIYFSASVGSAIGKLGRETLEEIIQAADIDMYKNKKGC